MDTIVEFSRGLELSGGLQRPQLPLTLEVDAMAGNRVADVALLLGLIAVFWGLGRLLKGAGMPGLRPFVFASGLTGILLLFLTNTDFYMVAGVRADAESVTVMRHLGGDVSLRWDEVQDVRLEGGSLYPVFSDDTSLVLVGSQDRELALPRFVPGIGAVAAELAARLGSAGHVDQAVPKAPAPAAGETSP